MAQNIDKADPKYQAALIFVNAILKNLNKPEITDLTDFRNIYRCDIITDENKAVVDKMSDILFKENVFDKKKCGYYRRKHVQNYILTLLRYICSELGLKLTITEKKTQKENIAKKHMIYTIYST